MSEVARLRLKVRHGSNLSERESRRALRLVHLADAFVIRAVFVLSVRDRLKLTPITCLAKFVRHFGENRLCLAHRVIFISCCVRHHREFHIGHIGILLLQ